jgi:hypothetical protein
MALHLFIVCFPPCASGFHAYSVEKILGVYIPECQDSLAVGCTQAGQIMKA